jgi:hypothetical protein
MDVWSGEGEGMEEERRKRKESGKWKESGK